MPEPFEELTAGDDGGYTVLPARIGRRSRRSTWLTSIGLLAVTGLVAVAILGPRPEDRPAPTGPVGPSAAPRPTATHYATPLPRLAFGPAAAPTRPIPMADRDGLTLLDPATGESTPAGFATQGDRTGTVFTDPAGRLVCLCVTVSRRWTPPNVGTRPGMPTNLVLGLAVERYDPSTGRLETSGPPIEVAGGTEDLDATLAPEGAAIHLAALASDGAHWTLRFLTIAVPDGELLGATEVAMFRVPGPAAEGSLSAVPSPRDPPMAFLRPRVRVSPDGELRLSLVGQVSFDGNVESDGRWIRHAWAVELDDQAVPTVVPLPDDEWPASTTCDQEGFAGSFRYVRVCFHNSDSGSPSLTEVVLETPDGQVDRRVPLGYALPPAYGAALVDDRDGVVFFWSPDRHVLVRLSAVTGQTIVSDLGTTWGDVREQTPTRIRPPSGPATHWSRLSSIDLGGDFPQLVPPWRAPTIVGSPDGSLVYALGGWAAGGSTETGGPASTGVLVFNAASLDLVDAWPPTTAYHSIGLAEDGRLVLVVGAPWIDADGGRVDWAPSLTVLDAATGDLSARYGTSTGSIDSSLDVFDPNG